MQTELEAKKFKLSEAEAAYHLKEAWKKIYNEEPTLKVLAIVFAKTSLETGRFKAGLWNYNFGNVKAGTTYDGYIQFFRCSEIINGKEVWFDPKHPQTRFRAYLNATDGAVAYLQFLNRPRYAKALAALREEEDVVKFITELKNAGYFTASLAPYLKAVVSLYNEFLRRADELLSYKPPVKEPEPPKPEVPPEQPKEEPKPSEPIFEQPKKDVAVEPDKTTKDKVKKYVSDISDSKYKFVMLAFAPVLLFILALIQKCQ